MTTLSQLKKGQRFRVRSIPDRMIEQQAVRLGIGQGAVLYCLAKLPGGPVVVRQGIQEIAVGRNLANHILVERLFR